MFKSSPVKFKEEGIMDNKVASNQTEKNETITDFIREGNVDALLAVLFFLFILFMFPRKNEENKMARQKHEWGNHYHCSWSKTHLYLSGDARNFLLKSTEDD